MVILGVIAPGLSFGLRRPPTRTPAATLFDDGTRFDDDTSWIDAAAVAATLSAEGMSLRGDR